MPNERSPLLTPERANPARALREAADLRAQGRLAEAEQRYQYVLRADEHQFDALYGLGLIQLQQGRPSEATKLFRRAIRVDRRSAHALQHLGVALSARERHSEAIEHYRAALALRPDLAEAHNNLGHSLQQLGRFDAACASYRRAIEINPDYPEAHNNLGISLQSQGRIDEAMTHYAKAQTLRPDYVDALKNLGNALGMMRRHGEATVLFERVLAVRPRDGGAHKSLADLHIKLDEFDAAIRHYRKALDVDARDAEALCGLGYAYYTMGRTEEAIALYRRALAIAPGDAGAYNRVGEAMQSLGRSAEATAAFERALALTSGKAGYWNLANSKHFATGDALLLEMRALLRDERALGLEQRIDLHFGLGKALRDVGEDQASFEQFRLGNLAKRSQIAYDEAAALGRLARIEATFTPALLREHSGLGDPSADPIFIVGMPRSGTTLVEQIIASHPEVHGAGELRVMAGLAERIVDADGRPFPEAMEALSADQLRGAGANYLAALRRLAPSARKITDKMPGNFALLGLIRLALPNARIIHVRRDPRDVAVSCFSILFARGHEFTCDLAELGRYIAAYRRLMDHWRAVMPESMLEVRYEDLVGDFEPQARRLVAYCGLEWNEACGVFYRNGRAVRTASANEVRRPVHQDSVGRWRAHEAALRPLLETLA